MPRSTGAGSKAGSKAGPSAGSTYRIGGLAQRAGVTVRTVRYYEELGILEPSNRTRSPTMRA